MCALLAKGFAKSHIAKALDRSLSTIYRELKRNLRPSGSYAASVAHSYYRGRRKRSRRGSHFTDEIWSTVISWLKELYSPDQIVATMKKKLDITMSIQTIYRFIKKDRRNGGQLYKYLRIMPKVRRKSYASKDSRGRLAGKKHVSERSEAAARRSEIGHWEVDTVQGCNPRDCILTVVDRKSGMGCLEKMLNKTAEEALLALYRFIGRHKGKVKTLTFDNGTEFHSYKRIEKRFKIPCYFATPHHPWERGCNENYNGLLRQYLKKGEEIQTVSYAIISAIEFQLNSRPRKRLEYKSPLEVYIHEN